MAQNFICDKEARVMQNGPVCYTVVELIAQHFIWDKEARVMQNGPVCCSGTNGSAFYMG